MGDIANLILVIVAVVLYIMAIVLRSKKSKKNAYWLELLSLTLMAIYFLPQMNFAFKISAITSILVGVFVISALFSKLLFHKK